MNDHADESPSVELKNSQGLAQTSPASKTEYGSEPPNRLGKRARTAYFIFQDEKRAQFREQVGSCFCILDRLHTVSE